MGILLWTEAIDDHWVLPIIGDIGSVHDVMGMAVLVLTTIGLLCLLPILNFDLNKFVNKLTDTRVLSNRPLDKPNY